MLEHSPAAAAQDLPQGGVDFRSTIVAIRAKPTSRFPRCASVLRRFIDWIFGPLQFRVECRSVITINGQVATQETAWRYVGESFGCCFQPLVLCRRPPEVSPEIAAAGDAFLSSVTK